MSFDGGQAEVANFYDACLASDENIVAFEVSVENDGVARVQIFEAEDNLARPAL